MIVYNTRNNIKVVVCSVNIQEVVSMGMFFRVGSCDEKQNTNGITHLLEHILSDSFIEKCNEVGGRANALTTKEYCCFFSKFLNRRLRDVLDCFREICEWECNASSISKAKKTVLNEMQGIDEEQYSEQQLFEEHLWGETLRFLPIGKKENIEQITQEQIRLHYKYFFRPDNCVISIVGFIDEDKVIQMIEEIFGGWYDNMTNRNILIKCSDVQKLIRSKQVKYRNDSTSIRILFDGVGRNSEKRNAYVALCKYLGGGIHSQLFQFVRKEMIAYNVFCVSQSFMNRGIVYLKIIGISESPVLVMQKISNLLLELKEIKISNENLLYVKKKLMEDYIYQHETVSSKMTLLGLQLLFDGIIKSDKEMIESITNVTTKEMEEALNDMLSNSITLMFENESKFANQYFNRYFV